MSRDVDITDLHVPLAGSRLAIGRSDHRNASCCSIAGRNLSQIEAGEVVCGLLTHDCEQRSEAFVVR